MKNTKFLSLICLLCILFSLFTPALAVSYAPESTTATETDGTDATEAPEKTDASDDGETSDDANTSSDAEALTTEPAGQKAGDYYAGIGTVDAPQISARNALLIDLETGTTYFSRDPDARAYPASLTKILTVLLAVEAIERGDLDLKQEITAGEDCLQGLDEQSSTAGIVPGETMTLENYLYCAMISSANEACNVIATTVSGSIDAFVERMNSRAVELGCTDTHFVNPHGMPDDDHYTTASDLAKITQEAMQHDLFVTVCNTLSRTIPATNKSDTRELQNTNGLINRNSVMYPGYYYEPAAGVKTGHTNAAGYCLVSTALKDDIHMLCIVLGAGEGTRDNGTADYYSFTDSITLYRWVFDHFSRQTILGSTELVGSVHVEQGSDTDSVALRPQNDIIAVLPNGVSLSEYERKITVYSERDNVTLTAPISAGEVLGEISIEKDGVVYGTAPLVATVDVAVARGAVLRSGLRAFFAHPVVIGILLVAIAVIVLYIMMLVRYHKRQKARKRAAARARREASARREHQARDEILRELTRDTRGR
ncbi:MAG: D-alanyl-D-alanine carboxypeptidase [Oscillospiraceae bacterium]|nr:D-alanyl-D-alanine carboxypeptidase [Oscillospiraceae bacterium]